MTAAARQVWVEVAQVVGAQSSRAVDSGLTNTGLAKPSEYRVYAISSADTRFTYRVEVLARVSLTRRAAIAGFVQGIQYAALAWS